MNERDLYRTPEDVDRLESKLVFWRTAAIGLFVIVIVLLMVVK